MLKRLPFVLLFGCFGVLAGTLGAADKLAADFKNPPNTTRAGVWWRWVDGNVTREGITRDLTEMSRKGIRSVDVFDVGGGVSVGPAAMMGTLWRDLFKHTLTEAARLGIEVRVVAAAGWGMGGPWIDATNAAKKLSYTEMQVDGPRHLSATLPKPLGAEPLYQDVAVVAFREKENAPVRPAQIVASSELGNYCTDERNWPAEDLADGDPDTCWKAKVAPSAENPAWIELRYHEPIKATSFMVVSPNGCGPRNCELQASTDGKMFAKVMGFELAPGESKRVGFPPAPAKVFRLLMTSAHVPDVRLAEICVLRQGDELVLRRGIKWWLFKSGKRSFWDWPKAGPAVLNDEYGEAEVVDCRSAETVELTAKMTAAGRVDWDVPPGRWAIARFGTTLVGEPPRSMSAALKGGYEADPYSRKAADLLYDKTAKMLLADADPQACKALKGVLLDSYEIGASAHGIQATWTDGFRGEFRRRNGYDLIAYLPAMARRVVDGRSETGRFLWDYRQVLAGLYLDFYSQMTARAHRDGLRMRAENGYGSYPFPHIDGLAAYGRIDEPMGEFWFNDGGPWGLIMAQHFHFCDSVRTAASASHIYDKPLVAAEALTIADGTRQSPGDWKATLDAQFCNGLNNTMIHLWSHQYDIKARPGLFTFDAINANMTWWEQSPAFLNYIARCQYLLRHGRFVADFCYFFGEDTARFVPGRKQVQPALPAGCDFDGLNAEVILSRLSCKNGRPALPNGQTYRYLVVPSVPGWNVTVPVLQKISKLVRSGMTVIGAKPGGGPGLGEAAEEIQQRQEITDVLWGQDASGKLNRKVGKGRVISGEALARILAADGVPPDVAPVADVSPGWDSVNWIHRRSDDADIYFLANNSSNIARQTVSFRVAGQKPELWDPLAGTRRDLPEYASTNGCTSVPLELEPNGSAFVVFRDNTRKPDGSIQKTASGNFPELKPVQEIAGPWTVQFDPQWGGPGTPVIFSRLSDWKEHADPRIKFYSGTAVYRTTFNLPPSALGASPSVSLDLGAVKEMAEVRLNGKTLGTVWCAPWRVEITNAVRNGANTLEISVANLWNNRMVGDAALPADKRVTRSNAVRKQDDPLLASGLLGPVVLQRAGKVD